MSECSPSRMLEQIVLQVIVGLDLTPRSFLWLASTHHKAISLPPGTEKTMELSFFAEYWSRGLNADILERYLVGCDLDPNCLALIVFHKEFFEKVDFEKNQQMTKSHAKFLSMQSLHYFTQNSFSHSECNSVNNKKYLKAMIDIFCEINSAWSLSCTLN